MKVYFAQHAEAVDKATDSARPISSGGAASAASVAAYISKFSINISTIRHSGKLRAQQTAEIFAKHLGVNEVFETEGMDPNDDVIKFIDGLKVGGVLYVGHLPHLDRVVSCLIGGGRDQGTLAFKNAGIACVEVGEAGSSLYWYVTPEIC
ncbi:MAG: phosphohistidine phosphatase SixA [bacterium]